MCNRKHVYLTCYHGLSQPGIIHAAVRESILGITSPDLHPNLCLILYTSSLPRCSTRTVGPKSCSSNVSQCIPIRTLSSRVSSSVANRNERTSQTSNLLPFTKNAIKPRCVIRTIFLYLVDNSFNLLRTHSARCVAPSLVVGG